MEENTTTRPWFEEVRMQHYNRQAEYWQQKEVLRVLHEADRQAVAGGTPTRENSDGGGALCGVVLEELAYNWPEQLETLFQGAVAARTERLLGSATSLPLVLPCSGTYALERVEGSKRNSWRERSSGDEHVNFITGAEVHDHHCHRLQEAVVTLGCDVDWNRTLRTDDEDLLYRSFVEWQMRLLREQGRIKRCKRPVIFSVEQDAPCPAHKRRTEIEAWNTVMAYIGVRQELCVRSADQLPPHLLACVSQAAERGRRCYVVSLCQEGRLARSDSQTSCRVDPAAELGVFVVLGRQPAVNEDDVWPDKVVIEGERDEHDGEQWLAICSEDVATHMAHQGFTMATKTEEEGEPGASGDQSQSAANLSKEAGRPAQGRRTRRLVRLAELKGRDLIGLSVRCTSVGAEQQESRTVPISPDQPDSKAKGDKEWAKDHIVFVASGGDDTKPPGYPLSMADKQRVERVLASRDTFRYYACSEDIQSLAGGQCIVALADSYYLPLAASPEWKAQVRQVIYDAVWTRTGCRVRHLLELLDAEEWHIARYGGTGIPLPWSPQMVITPWCEQALVHAFLAVAPALRRGCEPRVLNDQDWDQVFAPTGRSWGDSPPLPEHLAQARDLFRAWYPLHILLAPAKRGSNSYSGWSSSGAAVFLSLLLHVAIWGPAMCPRAIQFVDPVEIPYQGWGPRPSSPGGVTLSRFGASLAGLKRVTGVRFRAGEDENYVQWAQLPNYPELRDLYKVYFVMLSLYRHSGSMRPDNYSRCVFVLWAHLRDPGSAFGQLPLELVVHILRLTRASSRQVHLELAGDFVALEDVKFGRALHQNLKTLARALHGHRPKAAVKFIFDDMLRSLRRYRTALGSVREDWSACSVKLVRRFCKIVACGLSPVCPNLSALVWRSFIACELAPQRYHAPLPQDQPAIDAALGEMSRWWRKHVSRAHSATDGAMARGHVVVVAEAGLSTPHSRWAELASRYLERLADRVARAKRHRPGNRDRPATARITVCQGTPEWVSVIVAALTSRFDELAAEAGGQRTDEVVRRFTTDRLAREQVRAALARVGASWPVVADLAVGEEDAELMRVVAHLRERIASGGLPDPSSAYDEAALIRRFAGHIARQASVSSVEVVEHHCTVERPTAELLCVPGRPLVEVWI